MSPRPEPSDPQALGVLLLLQSSILGLEDERQISELIDRGLAQVPGVEGARLELASLELGPGAISELLLPLQTPRHSYGTLVVEVADPERLSPYLPFLRNFANVVALYLENRRQRHELEETAELASKRSAELESINASLSAEIAARGRAEKALRFLAEAGAMLTESLDYESTLSRLFNLVVPGLASWFVVDLLEEGHARRLSTAFLDPPRPALLRELQERFSNQPLKPAAEAMRTRAPVVQRELAEHCCADVTEEPDQARLLLLLELRELVSVPLLARERVVGAMTLASRIPGRYGPLELELVQDLGRRAATAIENAQLYRQSREAVQARDEFLSIASHDLRGALSTVQLAAESLRRRASSRQPGGLRPEEIAASAERVIAQVDRLEHLLEQLMDVSRISAGRMELRLESVDLAEVVAEVVGRAQELSQKNRAPFVLKIDRPIRGTWDKLRLEQVVANLVSNAVEIEARAEGALARLVVRDHGIGIAKADQARIFRRFERAAGTREISGIGLGLWIVHQIVDAFDGTIEVKSAPGKGATFTVRLPRHGMPSYRGEAPAAAELQ